MRVLVTGGNGFLGSWIVRGLVDQGHDVRILHRKSSDMTSLKDIRYEGVLGDVTDEYSLGAACEGVKAVIHSAAIIAYSPSDFAQMENVNVQGTRNVVKACLTSHVGRLVHTSSVVAVGASFDQKLLNEDSPFNPALHRFGYYETKRQAEDVIREAVQKSKLDAVIVNPSVMFGAGDAVKSSRKTHLKVASGEFPFYPPGGVNIMHVQDAVLGHIAALERGRAGERYILGGENVLIKDMFGMLAHATGHKPPRFPIPKAVIRGVANALSMAARLGAPIKASTDSAYTSTLFHWYDISKAKSELGLAPRPANEAVAESVRWAVEHGYL